MSAVIDIAIPHILPWQSCPSHTKKERELNLEDDRIRAWLRTPKEENWEDLDEDPTILTIDEETGDIFESRTYRLPHTPEACLLFLDMLHEGAGPRVDEMPPQVMAQQVFSVVDDTMVSRYQKRISGPLLHRIDIHIEVSRVKREKLTDPRLTSPPVFRTLATANLRS